MRAALLVPLVALSTACFDALPPNTLRAERVPSAAASHAKVVFLWNTNSCESGGYYTLATAAGRFLGNLYSDTRLEADVEPGEQTFVAWNPEVENDTGRMGPEHVAAARGHLSAGRTYFVRLAFGEWDERGPRGPLYVVARGSVVGHNLCRSSDPTLVALTPGSSQWPALRGWLDELRPMQADSAAGQKWLDDDPALLPTHVSLASQRFFRFTAAAKELATITPVAGVFVIAGNDGRIAFQTNALSGVRTASRPAPAAASPAPPAALATAR